MVPFALAWVEIIINKSYQAWKKYILVGSAIFVFSVTLFSDAVVSFVNPVEIGQRLSFVTGEYYTFYTLYQVFVFFLMIFLLVYKINSVEQTERIQRSLVMSGTLLYGFVTFSTSMIQPLFNQNLHNTVLLYSYDTQSSLFLVVFSTYAILRYKLFDIKVVAAELFTILIWIISSLRLLFAKNIKNIIFEGAFLVSVVFLGTLLIRSIKKEIDNREKGERLARYLANANARLRELDKQKTEFVSIASHQLRSPIAAIKGYTSLISEGTFGEVPEKIKEPLRRILESGQRIGIMVDDFLNVTRIEQGRMSYDMKPRNICDILDSVVGELKVVVEEKGLQIIFEHEEGKKYFVKADEGKLRQIFSNLIDNAIKYTPKGTIQVSVSSLEREKKVLVKIKDTGIGIARDEIQNLFQKFNRASNANEENVLGTGLGLYIAREILKMHEGWVGVESDGVGKGSTFTVELPACEECEKGA
jgi:signal transduction histidine kinase